MAALDYSTRLSASERLLHRMAFNGVEIQKSLADIEDRMHKRELGSVAVKNPVFVTSLPRAGTTLLLECIAALPEFTAHTYRRMPFLLCPLLWESVSRGFRRKAELSARAHGDGMLVSSDSPEAFEEILWMAFWPEKYGRKTIAPWSATDRNREFERFFHSHIRKLLLLSRYENKGATRYVSKNNANIARLPLLRQVFPDAVILVPFREPFAQASSLLRQHLNFLRLHASDSFGRDYMGAIGHLEFGQRLHRIAFAPGEGGPVRQPTDIGYWLNYWTDTFAHLLETDCRGMHFISYEKMCSAPEAAADMLNNVLQNGDLAEVRKKTARFRLPTEYGSEKVEAADEDLRRAEAVYRQLLSRAKNGS